ncbi:hypothetical protein DVG79_04725 [Exiguobacterium sp. RIT594]|nr:hypothetical protein DVG79_04725 [Exiguobacterium sp. RIT594]
MSIHRGLVELKSLDKRIQKAQTKSFIGVQSGNQAPAGYPSVVVFAEEAKANLQSVRDLMERRNRIKSAITASNAVTIVRMEGREMTVAEAIDRRDTGLVYERQLLQTLREQLRQVEQTIETERQDVVRRADSHIEATYGSREQGNADEMEKSRRLFLERLEPNLIDPSNLRQVMTELDETINMFETEVDFTLSESNTVTKIFA